MFRVRPAGPTPEVAQDHSSGESRRAAAARGIRATALGGSSLLARAVRLVAACVVLIVAWAFCSRCSKRMRRTASCRDPRLGPLARRPFNACSASTRHASRPRQLGHRRGHLPGCRRTDRTAHQPLPTLIHQPEGDS